MTSTVITDYLGKGLASARPATPPVAAGALALYLATDSGVFSRWNASGWEGLLTGMPVPLPFIMPGKTAVGQAFYLPIGFPLTIPANLAGSLPYAAVRPTGSPVFTVNRISGGTSSLVGTITVTPTAFTLSTQAATNLLTGDILQLVLSTPATQDATMAELGIAILSTRT